MPCIIPKNTSLSMESCLCRDIICITPSKDENHPRNAGSTRQNTIAITPRPPTPMLNLIHLKDFEPPYKHDYKQCKRNRVSVFQSVTKFQRNLLQNSPCRYPQHVVVTESIPHLFLCIWDISCSLLEAVHKCTHQPELLGKYHVLERRSGCCRGRILRVV
jgi:hypothetical protein